MFAITWLSLRELRYERRTIMKAVAKKPLVGKIIGCLIVATIISGMAFMVGVADIDKGSGIMGTVFVAFLGAIIAVQVLPGLMLFGMMVKGFATLFHKAEATRKVR
jgi:hypothetical protein